MQPQKRNFWILAVRTFCSRSMPCGQKGRHTIDESSAMTRKKVSHRLSPGLISSEIITLIKWHPLQAHNRIMREVLFSVCSEGLFFIWSLLTFCLCHVPQPNSICCHFTMHPQGPVQHLPHLPVFHKVDFCTKEKKAVVWWLLLDMYWWISLNPNTKISTSRSLLEIISKSSIVSLMLNLVLFVWIKRDLPVLCCVLDQQQHFLSPCSDWREHYQLLTRETGSISRSHRLKEDSQRFYWNKFAGLGRISHELTFWCVLSIQTLELFLETENRHQKHRERPHGL